MVEQENSNSSLFQLNLDTANSYTLRSAASWAKVTGVAGIIIGLITTILFIITLIKVSGERRYGYNEGGMSAIFSDLESSRKLGIWLFILMGLVFIVGGIFSFSFGNKIGAAFKANNQDMLENGFASLRNYYALRGVILIIVLLLILLMLASLF